MPARAKPRCCVDCTPSKRPRPAPYPGPRCATHNRARKQTTRTAAHARWIWNTYKLTAERYQAIYEHQGRRCYICHRAKGHRKRLAVDHDHKCCPTTPTCGECTRGLVCLRCNKMLGQLRDDPDAFRRGAYYLENPPAWEALGIGKISATTA